MTTRREELARARQSRRPSRLGTPAGSTPEPDHVLPPDAGFPRMLAGVRAAAEARLASDPAGAVRVLLTLDGHVPQDVQLRALRGPEEAALDALYGLSWRGAATPGGTPGGTDPGGPAAFLGEVGLTRTGRVAVRVPSQEPLDAGSDLVGGALRVPWSAGALAAYREGLRAAVERERREVADAREWLAGADRDALLGELAEAALRTAPFVLYQGERTYTNFRERNTLTGKTLWPGHPDCALSALRGLPLELWSDSDVLVVTCLTLLVRSAGYARVEEANGTQLTVAHVAHLLDRVRRLYGEVPPARSGRVADVLALADALKARRGVLTTRVQLYREIHGALVHKEERIAAPPGPATRRRLDAVLERLADRLPVSAGSLEELGDAVAADPGWLAAPHRDLGTGLESLVYETVAAAGAAFGADFAMSRGIRSLPELVAALRAEDWARITRWDIKEYFCCVVPSAAAAAHFGGSLARVADAAWAMSSRMQYNSWHFIAGGLPREPAVLARDFFAPPTIPDLAYFSDLHHHGHVAAQVRWSIRSPQAVEVLGRRFSGFVDLRLLRNAGDRFDEADLLGAAQVSRFVARATGAAAGLVAAGGADLEVTAFDSAWHWAVATGTPAPVPAR